MDGSAAALLDKAAELIEDERVRILVDEELPELRAQLERLLTRAPELRQAVGVRRAAALLVLLSGWRDALVAFEASR